MRDSATCCLQVGGVALFLVYNFIFSNLSSCVMCVIKMWHVLLESGD